MEVTLQRLLHTLAVLNPMKQFCVSVVSAGSTFAETAEHISLPDDCTIGYIVEALLGVSLTRSPLFHSHLENLDLVSDIHSQVRPRGLHTKARK